MNITKRVIRESFMELLNERPMNRITVKDITDRCGVNRNTFYYHYQDVPALVEEICAQQVERLVQDYPKISSIEECLDAAMKFALENKRAIMHLQSSSNWGTYVSTLWRICEQAVRTYVDTVFGNEKISDRDREIIIRYLKCECFGLNIDWISNGMKTEILDDMHRLCELKEGSTEEMIRRSQGKSQRFKQILPV